MTYIARPMDKADNTYIDIVVPNGANTDELADMLVENGIIESKGRFTFLSTVLMHNNKYKPGIYSLSPSMNMNSISNMLINGITTSDGFIIPDGYTVKQTAEALDHVGFADADTFKLVASSGIFTSQFDFLEGSSDLEGYLLPGHYEMSKDADEAMIIAAMLYQFDEFYTEEYRIRTSELGLSTRELVILASIVENESKLDKEMGTIASVLLNRISAGIGIEGGMPSKPLCSPSREAIEAVLYSEETDYLYYVLAETLDGTHIFTSDYAEYEAAKLAYEAALEAKNSVVEK